MIGTQTNIVIYDGDGVAVTFPFTFPVYDDDHLTLYNRVTLTGTYSIYSPNVYSVSGVDDENGGSVTLDVAPAVGEKLIIVRRVPLTQDLDVLNQGGFYPENFEEELDLIEMQIQQIDEELDRSIRFPIGESLDELPSAPNRANKLHYYGPAGEIQLIDPGILAKGDPGGNIMSIGLFIIANTLDIPDGTNTVRTSGYSVDGIGAAEYVYDAAVDDAYVILHPETSFVSNNDRGFRLVLDQGLQVTMFGALGDGTDDGASFLAAIAFANSLTQNTAGRGVPAILIPAGNYNLDDTTLELTRAVSLIGENRQGTVLSWANGTTGIRVQHGNTTGASGVQADSGYRPVGLIANMTLDGSYAGGPESEAHAIHRRSTTFLDNLLLQNWPGEGIYEHASLSDGAVLGNANLGRNRNVLTMNCRKGLYTFGTDVNAGMYEGIGGFENRQWSIHDNSFLGNTYLAPHAEGNARTIYNTGGADEPCSYVTEGGNQYFCIPGEEAWASVNAPSGDETDNQGWGFWQAGGVATGVPAWFSGINVRAGGGYFIEGLTNPSVLINPYCEDNQINLFDQCVVVIGGTPIAFAWKFSGGVLGASANNPNGPNLFYSRSEGLRTAGNLTVKGNAFLPNAFFGHSDGDAVDTLVAIDTTSVFNRVLLRSWNAGVDQQDGHITSANVNAGLRLMSRDEMWLGTMTGAGVETLIATVHNGGLRLEEGTALQIGLVQVVGEQQPGIGNDASGAANQATVNAILGVLRTHGLIAT